MTTIATATPITSAAWATSGGALDECECCGAFGTTRGGLVTFVSSSGESTELHTFCCRRCMAKFERLGRLRPVGR